MRQPRSPYLGFCVIKSYLSRNIPNIDPSRHAPQRGTVLPRMMPESARFEDYGTPFLKHLGVCQMPVAWDCPGGPAKFGPDMRRESNRIRDGIHAVCPLLQLVGSDESGHDEPDEP